MPCRAVLLLALLCDGLICEGLCITNVIGLALVGLRRYDGIRRVGDYVQVWIV